MICGVRGKLGRRPLRQKLAQKAVQVLTSEAGAADSIAGVLQQAARPSPAEARLE